MQICTKDSRFNSWHNFWLGIIAAAPLFWTAASGFADDGCTGATVVTSANYTNLQSTVSATGFEDSPPPSCAPLDHGVWYRYTAPANGTLIVDTFGSDFDTVLAAYSGACGALVAEDCNDDINDDTVPQNVVSRISLHASSGTTYYVLAGGYNDSGNLVFHLSFTTSTVANDQCSGAILIPGTSYTNTQSTVLATSAGDAGASCTAGFFGESFGSAVWYRYNPPDGGSIVVDALGSDFDTALVVYNGSCGALTEVGCGKYAYNTLLTNPVVAGTTYYIAAGSSSGGGSGNLIFHLSFLQGPPGNDQCANALVITGAGFTNTLSTVHATSTGDPSPSCAALSNGVWYAYTPTSNGVMTVDTLGSDFNTALGVYAGSCGTWNEVGCNENLSPTNPASRVSILASAGTPYYILAGGSNGQTGNLTFHLSFTTPLANDQCSGAIVVTGSSYTNTQSTITATGAGDVVPSCQSSFGGGVWYQFTPPATGNGGTMVVDTLGSDFDTVLAVYTGSCGALSEAGCSDNAGAGVTSQLTNPVVAGTPYYILAGGRDAQAGNLVFHLSFVEGPPLNDSCSGAIIITNSTYAHTQSTAKANSAGDPVTSCGALGKGVWYQYTPPASGAVAVDTAGSDFDTVLAAYSGSCGSLTPVACNDNVGDQTSRLSLLVNASASYYFLVGGSSGQTGNLAFHLSFSTNTPANDQCGGALVISSSSYTNSQSTLTATSTGDPVPSCVGPFGSAVWYRYTSATNGFLVVDTFGSDFDTVLGVYSGTSCGALSQVGCNDQAGNLSTSQVVAPVTPATTYYILAGGWGGQAGNLVLHSLLAQAPAITLQPVSKTNAIGSSATFVVTASGTAPLSYLWRRNGLGISGATAASYTTNNISLSGSGTQFSCLVTNAYGSVTSQVAVLNVLLTNTFQNTNQITINDAAVATPYPSSITVAGQSGMVGKVTVTMQGLAHTFPHDIGALLVGPQGQSVVLMADAGGGQPVTNLTLTFDDNASATLSEYGPLSSGSVQPATLGSGDSFPSPAPLGPYGAGLYSLRGANPNGTWSLYVLDDAAADSGRIARGWSLTLANEESLQIIQQPQNQSALPGSTVTFSVLAAGAMPLSYAWQRSGTNLPNGGRISGAASATLTISNVQSSDGANYSVALSCVSGAAVSPTASLTVLPPGHPWLVPTSLKHFNNGQFQFSFLGSAGSNYDVLVSSDFRSWKVLESLKLTGSSADILDTTTNLTRRFYRLRLTP
jgi:subtilisin-like proprotein convertase family protein